MLMCVCVCVCVVYRPPLFEISSLVSQVCEACERARANTCGAHESACVATTPTTTTTKRNGVLSRDICVFRLIRLFIALIQTHSSSSSSRVRQVYIDFTILTARFNNLERGIIDLGRKEGEKYRGNFFFMFVADEIFWLRFSCHFDFIRIILDRNGLYDFVNRNFFS